MYEKLKKKRNLILEKNVSKTSQNEEKHDEVIETCLLCHETSKKDSNMGYFARFEKEDTLAASFHGK